MTQAMLRPLPERASLPALDGRAPTIGGKFFFIGDHKLYLRGVSYGPFAASSHGFPLPAEETLERDLGLVVEVGANYMRASSVAPRGLLDRGAGRGNPRRETGYAVC